jgi:uncharacterized damage-inducible protein DinB
MSLDLVRYYFRYNTWATELMLAGVAKLSEADYNAPGCSGIGSVRDTVAHLFGAQQRWIEAMVAVRTPDRPTLAPFTANNLPTVTDARPRWEAVKRITEDYLGSLTEDEVRGPITLTHPRMGSLTEVHWKLLLHLANHGTHHRGQVFAAVRRAGHEPGASDLLYFILQER